MHKIIILLFLLSGLNMSGQNPQLNWVNWIKGDDFKYLSKVETSENGDFIIAGTFRDELNFTPKHAASTLKSTGGNDGLVCKYDSSGDLIWAKPVGGINQDWVYDIAESNDKSLYTAGSYQGTVDFDNGPGSMIRTATSDDGFLLKMNEFGYSQWVITFNAKQFEYATHVEVDDNGFVYVSGRFSDTVDFDPGVDTFQIISKSYNSQFICKYSPSGSLVWAKSIESDGKLTLVDMAVDKKSNIYFTGNFSDTIDFDPGPGSKTLTTYGWEERFLLKLNDKGEFVWAKPSAGIYHYLDADVLDVTDNGNIYTTGSFMGLMADFDPGPGKVESQSVGLQDVFIQCLDKDGNYIWHRTFGSKKPDYGRGIDVDSKGNVFLTGDFQEEMNLAELPDTMYIRAKLGIDIFNLCLDQNGNIKWAYVLSGNKVNDSRCIEIQEDKNIISAGTFYEINDIDPGPLNIKISSNYEPDIYFHSVSISNTVGLKQNLFKETVSVFPNPASDIFHIRNSVYFPNNATIEFINSYGIKIHTEYLKSNSTSFSINASGWNKGLYIYNLKIDGYVHQSGKLLLE